MQMNKRTYLWRVNALLFGHSTWDLRSISAELFTLSMGFVHLNIIKGTCSYLESVESLPTGLQAMFPKRCFK